ncbi:MAG: hypothetical protein M3N57_05910 [Actinomycetota bacterium]|nr:hypothetical protein [Actinomycetota bacterium]
MPDEQRPLLSERLRRLATPLGVLLAALLVVTLAFEGPRWLATFVAIAVVVLVLWLRSRSTHDDGPYGPGAS